MRRINWFLVGVVLNTVPAFADIVNVPPDTWSDREGTVITITERIRLHANVKRGERFQVRFLRGTKEQIKKGWINLPGNDACVAIPSQVFVAEGIDNGLVDLGFPQINGWLEAATSEPYVLVLEQITTPDLRHTVRLKPQFASVYVDRGLQVLLQAPPKPAASTPSVLARFVGPLIAAILPSASASASPAPAPPPPVQPPKQEPEMNCLQFP